MNPLDKIFEHLLAQQLNNFVEVDKSHINPNTWQG
jgi:hypothetical protein